MAEKKRTFTCKVCGGEHSGLICTKYSSVRVLEPKARKQAVAGLLAAPKPDKPKKAKKAKKKKRTKKRSAKQAKQPQPIAAQAEIETVDADIQPDKKGENS